jgi:hypothetical protein
VSELFSIALLVASFLAIGAASAYAAYTLYRGRR